MHPPIFIIGSPRSGTTVLGEFFETNSNCNYFLEVDIWSKKQEKPKGKRLSALSMKF